MNRLLIIDIIRGHLLLAVIWDHLAYLIGPSIFAYYNYFGLLWVSAAEGFVIISGFLLGYLFLYKGRYSSKEFIKIISKRIVLLYSISVVSTILVSIFFWGGNKLELSGIWRSNRPRELDFFELVLYSVLFIHHFGWMDIFVLYVWLFLIALAILPIMKKHKFSYIMVLIVSFLIWLFDNVYRLELNLIQVSSFRLLSWQFLFTISLVLGMHFERLRDILIYFYKKNILRIFVIVAFIIFFILGIIFPYMKNDLLLILFSKEFVGLGRLILSFFWLYSVGIILKILSDRINFLGSTLSYIGKESLYVYAVHAVIITFLDKIFISDLFLNSLCVFLITIFIYFLVYLKHKFLKRLG
ncbi:MAG: OpgC domain-containing protein [Candidatus Dojkabacteria bacterium]|nr:OpgC domain-containing protein [Candidatus Dojkabacteria bacterium]